jgi:hypothetical protein
MWRVQLEVRTKGTRSLTVSTYRAARVGKRVHFWPDVEGQMPDADSRF